MKQNLETKVGIFLMFGIAVICTLIIFFGEVGDLLKPTYNLTVRFENASGLLKGSDVYLSGALIGKVTTDPQHADGRGAFENQQQRPGPRRRRLRHRQLRPARRHVC
jgi:ABC-type transporter Mla subunit MlaD